MFKLDIWSILVEPEPVIHIKVDHFLDSLGLLCASHCGTFLKKVVSKTEQLLSHWEMWSIPSDDSTEPITD